MGKKKTERGETGEDIRREGGEMITFQRLNGTKEVK